MKTSRKQNTRSARCDNQRFSSLAVLIAVT